MKTEKLYYVDSYIKNFNAKVLSCESVGESFCVVLDKTAFFAEGGGQKADTGFIGEAKVLDVLEENGELKHYVDKSLELGNEYACVIDWDKRFSRMQNHSGEHIVSGITHAIYGFDNVGFHMEEDYVTVDFNGELNRAQLDEIEDKANEVIYKNEDIICYFPNSDELKTLDYRSKLDLKDDVRLVKIGDTDLCACCAPHVSKTGEIGVVKILDFMRHRGGVRLVMTSGKTALNDYREKYSRVYNVSGLLSAKQSEISTAVERLKNEADEIRHEYNEFKQRIAQADCKNLNLIGNVSYFISEYYDANMMRTLVNFGMEKSRICFVFSGDDKTGYSYIIGSNSLDMREVAKEVNTSLNGRGGGRDGMIQGKVSENEKSILDFLNTTAQLLGKEE